MVSICLDKSPRQLNSVWADFSKQMETICFGRAKSFWPITSHDLDGRENFPPVLVTEAVKTA